LVLGAVSMAVSIHLRAESSGREQVEESRLARTLLNLIAEDLRRVVPYDPQQDTRYKVAWPGISADTGEQFIDPELEAAAAEAGFEADPEALARAAEQTQADLASQPNAAGPAGLYGDSSALQLDTSRLPRIEALQAAWQLTDASVAADALALAGSGGDLKTVTYYLAENGSTGSGTSPAGATIAAMGSSGEGSSSTSWSAGLVRREMDRQKAVFAAEQGLLDVAEQHEQLVAPEVVGLQFRYFDGMEWFDEWDCQAKGGLPVAVAIGLTLRRPDAEAEVPPAAMTPLDADAASLGEGLAVYRLVVDLPAAVPTSTALEGATGEAEETAGSSTPGQLGEETQGGAQAPDTQSGAGGSGASGRFPGGGSSPSGPNTSPQGPGFAPPGGPGGGGSGAGRENSPPPGPAPGPSSEQDDRAQGGPR